MLQTFSRSSRNSCQALTDNKARADYSVGICSVEQASHPAILKRQRRLSLVRRSPSEGVKPRRRSRKRLRHCHPPLPAVQGKSGQLTRRAKLVQGSVIVPLLYLSRDLTFCDLDRARKPKSLTAMLRPLKIILLLVRLPPSRHLDLPLSPARWKSFSSSASRSKSMIV